METKENRYRKKFQKSHLVILFLGFILFLLTVLFLHNYDEVRSPENDIAMVHVESNAIISAEVAATSAARTRGLMGRTDINENEGMLFIFEESDFRTFWMLNTPQSLDIIFLDEDLNVINFHKSTTPNQIRETYSSTKPSKYVLEIKSGFIEKYLIKVGDRFEIIN